MDFAKINAFRPKVIAKELFFCAGPTTTESPLDGTQ